MRRTNENEIKWDHAKVMEWPLLALEFALVAQLPQSPRCVSLFCATTVSPLFLLSLRIYPCHSGVTRMSIGCHSHVTACDIMLWHSNPTLPIPKSCFNFCFIDQTLRSKVWCCQMLSTVLLAGYWPCPKELQRFTFVSPAQLSTPQHEVLVFCLSFFAHNFLRRTMF